MKKRLAFLAMTTTGFVHADTVSTIFDINYLDYGIGDSMGVSVTHYFDPRALRGPLDQFGFINSKSFVGISHDDFEFGNSTALTGTWHMDNGMYIGLDYRLRDYDSGSDDEISHTLGYQSNEVWSVSATFSDFEGAANDVSFNARYEHDLGENDYLAFSYGTNNDFDYHTITSRYFNDIEDGGYYTLRAVFTQYDDIPGLDLDDDWTIGGDYYWNDYTSAGVSFSDDAYSIGARHYFNDNWALTASYAELDSLDDDNMWEITLTAQF